jgi:hypothetical protein
MRQPDRRRPRALVNEAIPPTVNWNMTRFGIAHRLEDGLQGFDDPAWAFRQPPAPVRDVA